MIEVRGFGCTHGCGNLDAGAVVLCLFGSLEQLGFLSFSSHVKKGRF